MSSWNQGNAQSVTCADRIRGVRARYVARHERLTSTSSSLGTAANRPWTSSAAATSSTWPPTSRTHSTQYPNGQRECSSVMTPSIPTAANSRRPWLATSPRLGLVWDPAGHGKQTIRAAFGLMHDSTNCFIPERWTTNPPTLPRSLSRIPPSPRVLDPWNGYVSPTGVAGDPFLGCDLSILRHLCEHSANVHDTYMMRGT